MKKILVVLDGAADTPIGAMGGRTPLEMADKPNLDFFARSGVQGYMYPIDEHVVPESDTAIISILGNNYRFFKRGYFEAIGAGIKLKRGDLAARANFGTIKDLKTKLVIDRRAGRTLTLAEAKELAKDINKKVKLPCKFEFIPTVQHRGALILRGGFSDNITNIDSEWGGSEKDTFKFSEPLDEEDNSKYTANIINEFVDQSFKILNEHPINKERVKKGLMPANMIFIRGAGTEMPKLNQYSNWMSINSMPLEMGIAKSSGMTNFSFDIPKLKSMDVYENLYEILGKSIDFAVDTLKKEYKNYDCCYIQLKEADIAGHDNKPYEKKKMIEIIDKEFFGKIKDFIEKKKIKLVVTCDHTTSCTLKKHSSEPVPVLVYDGKNKDDSIDFSEKQSKQGSLGKFYGRDLFEVAGLKE